MSLWQEYELERVEVIEHHGKGFVGLTPTKMTLTLNHKASREYLFMPPYCIWVAEERELV
jgi:hypothetical protein